MTHTTQIEWHDDRPLIHFGTPPDVKYWEAPKVKKSKKKGKKRGT